MSANKFTPGPWVVLVDDQMPRYLRRGDAHLIAAAPDMLDALEEALLYLNNDETRDAARAAIKKARGGE